jgi:radical SAM superfamily enzyme YgiQ (UPF0313 family)
VALIGPEIEENLALRSLAACLTRAGYGTAIVPFANGSQLGPALAAVLDAPSPPLLVAVSLAFQWRALDCLAWIMALRKRGFAGHITAGGHFGSFAHAELLRDFIELDSLCCHEAEETLVALADALRDKRPLDAIAGLATRDQDGRIRLEAPRPIHDLAQLPWVDRRGEPASCLGHRVATLVGSRGCYHHCSFCCIAAWHALGGGKKLRLRPVDDLAAEMAVLHHEQGIDIFVFHDDTFFLGSERASRERIEALGAALAARGVRRFGTVVKARPNDVTPALFAAMRERCGLLRLFLGIESDATQGLATLARGVSSPQNHAAMEVLDRLGIYVCSNILLFDPDTSLESLEANLVFMERYGETPMNFGRVELYAGTPLLGRLKSEGRAVGSYLGHDYSMAEHQVQRVYELAKSCFHERNFADTALANRLMGTRFDVEVCRHFHPERFDPAWLAEAKALSLALARDSAAGLRAIIAQAQSPAPQGLLDEFAAELSMRLRTTETQLRRRAQALEEMVQAAVGQRCHHVRPLLDSRPVWTTIALDQPA